MIASGSVRVSSDNRVPKAAAFRLMDWLDLCFPLPSVANLADELLKTSVHCWA